MLLDTADLVWKYKQHSLLRYDHKMILSIFPVGSKWTGISIAEKLIEAGIATVHRRSARDNRIMTISCRTAPSVELVEHLCLGDAGIQRVKEQLSKGYVW